MRVFVPYDTSDPNTRLSPVLDSTEREAFATAMLQDVLAAVRAAGHEPTVLATESVERSCAVRVDERPLTTAVNAALDDTEGPVAVVMADLALATGDSVAMLLDRPEDVVLAPGLGGGTNALVARHPDFWVDYHGGSYRKHCELADDCDASLCTVDSFRLALDVDEPGDLPEVLLHGDGHAEQWLREAGFSLDTTDGRCVATRSE
jgi:2-phospho-L-lactate guanylyltransferase